MKSFFIGSLLILAFVCTPARSQAQSAAALKLGFVDFETIAQQMPEFKDIDARLKGEQKRYEDSLKAMQTEFQEKAENYQKQQGLMNADTKSAEEAKLNAIRERYLQFQQEALGPQGALAQLRAQLIQPLQAKIKEAIERVAKDDKLAAVMETSALAYYDKKLDITYKVLDYLRRGEK
jgi:outer membrane protein